MPNLYQLLGAAVLVLALFSWGLFERGGRHDAQAAAAKWEKAEGDERARAQQNEALLQGKITDLQQQAEAARDAAETRERIRAASDLLKGRSPDLDVEGNAGAGRVFDDLARRLHQQRAPAGRVH